MGRDVSLRPGRLLERPLGQEPLDVNHLHSPLRVCECLSVLLKIPFFRKKRGAHPNRNPFWADVDDDNSTQ